MSLSSGFIRTIGLSLIAMMLSAGCTFRPALESGSAGQYSIAYPSPGNEIEQTLIEELKFMLGSSASARYTLRIMTSRSTRQLYKTSWQFAQDEYEVTLRANFMLLETATQKFVARGNRFASSIYQVGPQIVANDHAEADADKRAARDIARQLSFTISAAIRDHES